MQEREGVQVTPLTEEQRTEIVANADTLTGDDLTFGVTDAALTIPDPTTPPAPGAKWETSCSMQGGRS